MKRKTYHVTFALRTTSSGIDSKSVLVLSPIPYKTSPSTPCQFQFAMTHRQTFWQIHAIYIENYMKLPKKPKDTKPANLERWYLTYKYYKWMNILDGKLKQFCEWSEEVDKKNSGCTKNVFIFFAYSYTIFCRFCHTIFSLLSFPSLNLAKHTANIILP